MPEIPDLTVYLERLAPLVLGRTVERVEIHNPFVLRTVDPPIRTAVGARVTALRRIGKRLVLALDGERFLVVHLMIAGRLRWRLPGKKLPGKLALAALGFAEGTLYLSEAGTTRRASMHLVVGEAALRQFDRGGLEPLDADVPAFAARLRSESHTVKRALTDPRLFSGIGNAYSDEILHAARLSPLTLTGRLTDDEVARLHAATHETLAAWTDRLRREVGDAFPETVTAFHDAMAVHGRAADPLRDQRDELLRAVPDGRAAARGPGDVAAVEAGLAADAGGAGGVNPSSNGQCTVTRRIRAPSCIRSTTSIPRTTSANTV
jgi:formamidopyrimidine-DNA glycosylase